MISKRFTTVLGTGALVAFAFIGYTDAVRISQDSRAQEQQVETLNVKREELKQELDQTIEVKQKGQEEVQQLEEEKQRFEEERKKLEQELQSNNSNNSSAAIVAVVSGAKI